MDEEKIQEEPVLRGEPIQEVQESGFMRPRLRGGGGRRPPGPEELSASPAGDDGQPSAHVVGRSEGSEHRPIAFQELPEHFGPRVFGIGLGGRAQSPERGAGDSEDKSRMELDEPVPRFRVPGGAPPEKSLIGIHRKEYYPASSLRTQKAGGGYLPGLTFSGRWNADTFVA